MDPTKKASLGFSCAAPRQDAASPRTQVRKRWVPQSQEEGVPEDLDYRVQIENGSFKLE